MPEQQKCKIVCLGDSITEGFGLLEGESYPCLLQRALGDGFLVFNAGVSAHCVTDELLPDGRVMGLPYVRTERYAQGIAEKGDIYVLLLGTNDAQDGMLDDGSAIDPWGNIFSKRENFIGHYERILNDIRQANPKAAIYVGRPTPVLDCIWQSTSRSILMLFWRKLMRLCGGIRMLLCLICTGRSGKREMSGCGEPTRRITCTRVRRGQN